MHIKGDRFGCGCGAVVYAARIPARPFRLCGRAGQTLFYRKALCGRSGRSKEDIGNGEKSRAKRPVGNQWYDRRSQKDCIETYRRVAEGAIGEIVSAHVTRLGGALWYVNRRPEWNDMEYMLRNWVNFCWTSGDLVVEQFVHEIDMMTWFLGDIVPVRAEATGGRQRRVTGDMYELFSVSSMSMKTACGPIVPRARSTAATRPIT